MNKNIIFSIAASALLLAVSCQKEETVKAVSGAGEADFYASLETSETATKTTFADDGCMVNWESSDRIAVNGATYTISRIPFPTQAEFVYESGSKPKPLEGPYFAFYPSDIMSECDSVIKLPESWSYKENSARHLPMFSYSEDQNLHFKNIFAVLKVNVDPEVLVSNIYVEADTLISGTFSVDRTGNVSVIEGSKFVNLKCPGSRGGNTFYLPLPPGNYKCLSVKVETFIPANPYSYEGNGEMVTKQSVTLVANTIYEVNFKDDHSETQLKTDQDFEKYVQSVYAWFGNTYLSEAENGYNPAFMMQNLCSDDVLASGFNGSFDEFAKINRFEYNADSEPVVKYFNSILDGIYMVNEVIVRENDTTLAKTMTTTMKRCIAEMRVLSAYFHLNLAMGWADPMYPNTPCIDSTRNALKPYTLKKRNELLKWCVEQCEKAIASELLSRQGNRDKERTCIATKGFARAIAGKAALFAGDNATARKYLSDLINSNEYALVPAEEYSVVFKSASTNPRNRNEEMIFVGRVTNENSLYRANNWRTSCFQADPVAPYSGSVQGYGCLGVPQFFGDALFSNDADSYRRKAVMKSIGDEVIYSTPYEPYESDDLYYYDSDIRKMSKEEKAKSEKVGVKTPWTGASFWLPFKWQSRAEESFADALYVPVMRYAEVQLMYAEACIGSSDESKGLKALQTVQERSGSGKISAALTLTAVKEEKCYELAFEGCRWFDIVRWGATGHLTDKVTTLCDKLHRMPQSGESVSWEYGTEANSRFYTIESGQRHFNSNKHTLFPYPTAFLAEHPDINQNPNW